MQDEGVPERDGEFHSSGLSRERTKGRESTRRTVIEATGLCNQHLSDINLFLVLDS